jgi:hypothetical protein
VHSVRPSARAPHAPPSRTALTLVLALDSGCCTGSPRREHQKCSTLSTDGASSLSTSACATLAAGGLPTRATTWTAGAHAAKCTRRRTRRRGRRWRWQGARWRRQDLGVRRRCC